MIGVKVITALLKKCLITSEKIEQLIKQCYLRLFEKYIIPKIDGVFLLDIVINFQT